MMYPPPSGFVDRSALAHPQRHERIISSDELSNYVAPLYNAADLSEDSTQPQRYAVYLAALRKLIDVGVLTPRQHPADDRLCLVRPQ